MKQKQINATPDYSPYAGIYAQSRPRYPDSLFSFLASLLDRHHLAWDCATGNGQAALELTKHFDHVIATDISAGQIEHAMLHPRIEYRVVPSEKSGLSGQSLDLVTVASALHWFDLESFYKEVRRVLKPGGVLAAWTYHVGYVEAPFDEVFKRFYRDILSPYFTAGARLVDNRYETITLPGKSLPVGEYYVTANWNLDQMITFISSWSGTQHYIRERGEDPVRLISNELKMLWGKPQTVHTVRWPLFIRVARL